MQRDDEFAEADSGARMYSLQVFDIDPAGRPVGIIRVGDLFETVSGAASEARQLALATHYRITNEGGQLVCEDYIGL